MLVSTNLARIVLEDLFSGKGSGKAAAYDSLHPEMDGRSARAHSCPAQCAHNPAVECVAYLRKRVYGLFEFFSFVIEIIRPVVWWIFDSLVDELENPFMSFVLHGALVEPAHWNS